MSTPIFRRHPIISGTVVISSLAFTAYVIASRRYPHSAALSPYRFTQLELISTRHVTHDTRELRLRVHPPVTPFSPISSIWVKDETMQVARPYTPVNEVWQGPLLEELVLLVKIYPDGQVSRHLDEKQFGDAIYVRGPVKTWAYVPGVWRHIGMIMGGTGITPAYQLIKRALMDSNDNTARISLIYASKSDRDILLQTELEELQRQFPQKLRIRYVVERRYDPDLVLDATLGWVQEEDVKRYMPDPGDKASVTLVCGPDGMMRHVCGEKPSEGEQGAVKGILGRLGYASGQVVKL